ncbi:hypothetical protein ACQVP2_07490 [Methylobacterium aquaticum]|uniref:hypothetical protein n=1 Tax=Methylobacterium aquaticum TaxID=270351 RepID=UPI003D17D0D5
MRQSRTRKAIRAILDRSQQWDPATMKISPTGEVTAEKDPGKTMRSERGRYLVGHVSDMLQDEVSTPR